MTHEFGALIRKKRKEAGLSLRAAAKHLDISHVYLGEIERGQKPPMIYQRWDDLRRVLDISTKELEAAYFESARAKLELEHWHDDAPVIRKLAEVIHRQRRLSPAQRAGIMSILSASVNNDD